MQTGMSRVRPVLDPAQRQAILNLRSDHDQPAPTSVIDASAAATRVSSLTQPAGSQLLLECYTQDLGHPKANSWRWFKDGKSIESLAIFNGLEQQSGNNFLFPPTGTTNNTHTNNNNNDQQTAPLPNSSQTLGAGNPISGRLDGLSSTLSLARGGGNEKATSYSTTTGLGPSESNGNKVPIGERRLGASTIFDKHNRDVAQSSRNDQDIELRNRHGQEELEEQEGRQEGEALRMGGVGGGGGGNQERAFGDQRQQRAVQLASGRYLLIPFIQLAHRGNYSCSAVNRFVSEAPTTKAANGNDSPPAEKGPDSSEGAFALSIGLGPKLARSLASETSWPEVQIGPPSSSSAGFGTGSLQSVDGVDVGQELNWRPNPAGRGRQLELICHVQCEPICQIEWLHNNEPLESKVATVDALGGRVGGNFGLLGGTNLVSYEVRERFVGQNETRNQFGGLESRLVLQFNAGPDATSLDLSNNEANNETTSSGTTTTTTTMANISAGREKIRLQLMDRQNEQRLARRRLLDGSNFTCQSGANAFGPPVRSSTKFVLQCEYLHRLLVAICVQHLKWISP